MHERPRSRLIDREFASLGLGKVRVPCIEECALNDAAIHHDRADSTIVSSELTILSARPARTSAGLTSRPIARLRAENAAAPSGTVPPLRERQQLVYQVLRARDLTREVGRAYEPHRLGMVVAGQSFGAGAPRFGRRIGTRASEGQKRGDQESDCFHALRRSNPLASMIRCEFPQNCAGRNSPLARPALA